MITTITERETELEARIETQGIVLRNVTETLLLVTKERDALLAALKERDRLANELLAATIRIENDGMELAALKQQEPYKWVLNNELYPVEQVHSWGPNKFKPFENQFPVYLAAGVQMNDKESWWAGARAGLGIDADTPRTTVASLLAAGAQPNHQIILDALKWAEFLVESEKSCQEAKWSIEKALAVVRSGATCKDDLQVHDIEGKSEAIEGLIADIASIKSKPPVTCFVCSEVHSILDADESKIIRNARDGYPEGREPRELTIAERVIALCVYAADWKRWCIGAQEPFKPDWVNYRQGKADGIAEAQERKPLTDDEIEDISTPCFSGSIYEPEFDYMAFARAIEAKIKEQL